MRAPDPRTAPAPAAEPGRGEETAGKHESGVESIAALGQSPAALPLFSYPPSRGTSRKGDPATSVEAARSMAGVVGQRQAEVLDALRLCGGRGCLDDVVAITGRERGTTSRRLTDLERGGLIERTERTKPGCSGRAQIVWAVIDR